MEMGPFLQSLSDFLPYPELYDNLYFKKFINDQNLVKASEFADHLVMALPSPRIDWYSSSDFDEV